MHKPAQTGFPLNALIADRWSPLAFSDRPVEREKLGSLMEAVRWSSSCYNEQPWYFIVANKQDNADHFDQLLSCIVEANQTWAKDAPILMLAIAQTVFSRNGKPNRHGIYDLGQSVATMILQAESMGLVAHQMGGFDPDRAREIYQVPPDCEIMAAIALGYQGNLSTLPPNLQERESSDRVRKNLDSFVFSEQWGKTLPLS
ncbi:MAG: nitroreductase family protein [Synechococcaceae cyanobacterium RL_1_2]|nr:nitroreductase family protein [Synechococcaceae cyanobacterium RL_1_2]